LVIDLIVAAGACLTNLPLREGMSYERLRERRPDLIMVVITGNPDGSTAVDYTINAAVGVPAITGPEASGPVNHVLPAWDVIAGHLAATAIMAAELRRARTGEGILVTLSLADVALATVSRLGFIAEAQLVSEPRARNGNWVYGTFGRDFSTADRRRVMITALTHRQWSSLTDATDTSAHFATFERDRGIDLRDEGQRFLHREELAAAIAPWIASRPLSEVRRVFDAHGVLWGPYQSFKELLADDARASSANPLFSSVAQPGIGPVLTAGSPLGFRGLNRVAPAPAPRMGAHTGEVLRSWLGLSDPELADLVSEQVIWTPE
jgi:2-methylfumaryl-CoA isomerase